MVYIISKEIRERNYGSYWGRFYEGSDLWFVLEWWMRFKRLKRNGKKNVFW